MPRITRSRVKPLPTAALRRSAATEIRNLCDVGRESSRLISREPNHSGHCCNTRVRCRIVSLIRDRCLIAAVKTSRPLSRLLPGIEHALDLAAILGSLLDLVGVAAIGVVRVVGLFVEDVKSIREVFHSSGKLLMFSKSH